MELDLHEAAATKAPRHLEEYLMVSKKSDDRTCTVIPGYEKNGESRLTASRLLGRRRGPGDG